VKDTSDDRLDDAEDGVMITKHKLQRRSGQRSGCTGLNVTFVLDVKTDVDVLQSSYLHTECGGFKEYTSYGGIVQIQCLNRQNGSK